MVSRSRTSGLGVGALAAASLVVACRGEEPAPMIALARPLSPGSCLEWSGQPIDRTCVPRVGRADAPLVLEVEERCGACGTTAERCSVSVEGRTITLSLDGKTCEPPHGSQCSESCAKSRMRCEIPALPEGRYTVRRADTSSSSFVLELASAPDAVTSCAL